jgi:hypothetical protein
MLSMGPAFRSAPGVRGFHTRVTISYFIGAGTPAGVRLCRLLITGGIASLNRPANRCDPFRGRNDGQRPMPCCTIRPAREARSC